MRETTYQRIVTCCLVSATGSALVHELGGGFVSVATGVAILAASVAASVYFIYQLSSK